MRSVAAVFIAAVAAAAEPVPLGWPKRIAHLPDAVNESSGLVRGKLHADSEILWTHNDSGDSARIFAVDRTGKLLREVVVPEATNVDWEDIAIDGRGRLVIGDIGDNLAKRAEIVLYRLPEPDALDAAGVVATPQAFHFRYLQGAIDAEAIVCRPGCAFLFSKEPGRTRVFRLPLPDQPPPQAVAAEEVAHTNLALITGADVSDDGCHLALVSYLAVMVFDLQRPLETLLAAPAAGAAPTWPAEFDAGMRHRWCFLGQTEGIAWSGLDLLLTTEQGALYCLHDAR